MNTDQQLTELVWTPEVLLTELADVGVFTIGLDLKIKSWSPGVESLFGYTKRDFIGQDASFIFTPEDRAQGTDEREFEEARRSGRSPDMRWHIKKDGGRIFVHGVLTAIRDGSGEHLGYVKIIRDIFPDSLRQRVIATVLDETPLAISIRDCQGRFALVNSPLAKLIGKPAAEIIGQFIDDILPPAMAGPIRQDDDACITFRTPHVIEEYFPSADQGRRTLLTGKAPLLDHQGRTVGVIQRLAGHYIAHTAERRARSAPERTPAGQRRPGLVFIHRLPRSSGASSNHQKFRRAARQKLQAATRPTCQRVHFADHARGREYAYPRTPAFRAVR